jgi:hypothetical protein
MGSSQRDETLLRRLGAGSESLESVAAAQGWTSDTMRSWFARTIRVIPSTATCAQCHATLPVVAKRMLNHVVAKRMLNHLAVTFSLPGTAAKRGAPFLMVFSPSRGRVPTEHDVRLERDAYGSPRIIAESPADCAFGMGWAMSEDRLFQLDYLRRKALGQLSEVLGPGGRCASLGDSRAPTPALALDEHARAADFAASAAAGWEQMSPRDRALLEAFCRGVNGQLEAALVEREQSKNGNFGMPIEFSLLDYVPDAFTPRELLALDAASESEAERLASDPAGWAWDVSAFSRLEARRHAGRHVLCGLGDGSLGVLLDCPAPAVTGGDIVPPSGGGTGTDSVLGLWSVNEQSDDDDSGGGCMAQYNTQSQRWEVATASDLAGSPMIGPGPARTTTVLRSKSTVMPTAGAARVEKKPPAAAAASKL